MTGFIRATVVLAAVSGLWACAGDQRNKRKNCGFDGKPACASAPRCKGEGSAPDAEGVCVKCSGRGEIPCPGGRCAEGLVARDGLCQDCGTKGLPACGAGVCTQGTVLSGGVCCEEVLEEERDKEVSHTGVRGCNKERAEREARELCEQLAENQGAEKPRVVGLNFSEKTWKDGVLRNEDNCEGTGKFSCRYVVKDCSLD